ncbi:unnamed protein product [Leptosia nina]|uniref:Odorant receptor n=1 Tax=Leptosia nina TaxID=320188 RepID=A0AAV1J9Q8_9NEOP
MISFNLKNHALRIKQRLRENRVENLLWTVDFMPRLSGSSLEKKKKLNVPIWIITVGLLIYIYGVGSFVYQYRVAESHGDYIKSNVNVSIFILTLNNCIWWIRQRKLLIKVLKDVKVNDGLARSMTCSMEKSEKVLSVVKKVVLGFCGLIMINALFIYLPNRFNISNDQYCMTPCVGMGPIAETPNRQLCMVTIFVQEVGVIAVDINYQSMQILLMCHTAAMYHLLAHDILFLDEPILDEIQYQAVKEKLSFLIKRHVLSLDMIKNIQSLYSSPMGVNFGLNTVCIGLIFYLPTEEWMDFCPFVIYCFFVFFLYCYLSQKLIDASELFERSVYACGWENFEWRERRVVYIMLLQAQKPIQLLAADIVPVNIYTFATTIQMLYKFVTVMKF